MGPQTTLIDKFPSEILNVSEILYIQTIAENYYCLLYLLYRFVSSLCHAFHFIPSFFSVCTNNLNLSTNYHPGLWNGKRWECCRASTRYLTGCESCSEWLNPENPLPLDNASVELQQLNNANHSQNINRVGEYYL